MKVDELLAEGTRLLGPTSGQNAGFEARYLLRALADWSQAELVLRSRQPVSPGFAARYRHMISRRIRHEPLQYITGFTEFWGLRFTVSPAALIPRMETEFVLEQVLKVTGPHLPPDPRVLDMGTGTGVIAVVLARELETPVVAVDSSPAALKLASVNARALGVARHIHLLCSDLYQALSPEKGFDLIVSNPPYVGTDEYETLHPEVVDYEPSQALFAGPEGLACYHRLIPASFEYLLPGGWLCLEIGARQANAVSTLLVDNGYVDVHAFRDYSGRFRLVVGRRSDETAMIGRHNNQ